jgi:L-threonylcarbamoyladenylate synthase
LSQYLADADQILDGGPCQVGVESTIIDCTGALPRILRPGAVTAEMISESTGLLLGGKFTYSEDDLAGITINGKVVDEVEIRVSGSLDSHYAPVATVVLDQSPVTGQGFIAMADESTPDGVVRLAAPNTHDEFARVLYAALRAADEQKLQTVVVSQPQGDGIAIAIRDRLKRAAHSGSNS